MKTRVKTKTKMSREKLCHVDKFTTSLGLEL